MPNSKFVLPFLGYKKNTYEFIGTSFLINPNILITAGHNVLKEYNRNYDYFSVYFNGKIIILQSPIFSEFREELVISGNYNDLAIFLFNESFFSPFILTDRALARHEKLEVYKILENFESNSIPLKKDNVTVNIPSFAYRNYPNTNGKARESKYENCFNLFERLASGYSGSPVFKDNLVYGMIVYSPIQDKVFDKSIDFGTSSLKSNYILKILKELF